MLKKRLRDWHITDTLPISPSTIYRSLDRLEKMGALASQTVQKGNYPPAKVYRITGKGRELYREYLIEEAGFAKSVYDLSTFVSLSAYLPAAERIRLMRQRHDLLAAAVQELDRHINDHTEGATYGKPFAEWLLYDLERHMLKSEMAWIKRYAKMIEGNRS
jgi:DNA-binding PadR family transcriptional regulator